ncbi:zinc ribbon domain-containing protein [Ferdinandcohnia sp. Marseille-Q9671]
MYCSNCGHQNDGGKFCEKCGTPLQATSQNQTAATVENTNQNYVQQPTQTQNTTSNQVLEATKNISKLYFGYFLQGLKSPTSMAQNVDGSQFINGLITMILYAISIPLMVYFGFKGDYFSPSFSDAVITPTIYYLIFIGFTALVTFIVIKFGKVQASIKDVFARFGAFLIVPTAFLLVALLFSLIQIKLFLLLLLFGFLGLFIIVPFTIYSYKQNNQGGLDGIYSTFITYLAIIILLLTVARVAIERIIDSISFF